MSQFNSNKTKRLVSLGKIIDSGRMRHVENTDIEQILGTIHGEKYTKYRQEWALTTSALSIPDRPLYIILETNSYCNMKCKMCSRNFYSKEEKINIADDIVERVIEDVNNLEIPSILVGASTECLINPNIKNIIKRIRLSKAIDLFLLTNGYCLTEEIANLLIDLQWERLYVSFDAATDDTYKKIRGANLNIVEKNINRILELKKEKKSALPLIRASFCIQNENKDEQEMFIEKWKDKVDIIDFQALTDYREINQLENLPNYDYQCINPFRHLNIDCKGNICPCGSAYGWQMIIGNIKEMTLKEAWDSKIMKDLRTNMLEKQLSRICRNCVKNTQLF